METFQATNYTAIVNILTQSNFFSQQSISLQQKLILDSHSVVISKSPTSAVLSTCVLVHKASKIQIANYMNASN